MTKIKEAGYKHPTPVQMQAIPVLFYRRNAIILAETGSGKSLSFIGPLLHMIKNQIQEVPYRNMLPAT